MPSSSLASRVYDDILNRILTGQLAPGEIFNRRQTAAELGVSVAPVLEAGSLSKQVYLPKGTWYNFWTDTAYEGGRWIPMPTQLDWLKRGS